LAHRALARRAVDAGLEVDVAEPAASAARDQHLLAVLVEVGDQLAGLPVGDDRTHRHAQHDVLAALAVAVRPAAVLAALGAEMARVAIVDQRVEVAVGLRVDAAAPPAITAVRPATGHELLAPERGR